MEQSFWEQLVNVLKIIIPVLVASIPGFIALRQQQIKNEAENTAGKGKAEEDKIQADATAVLLDSAGKTQKLYQELIGDIKGTNKDCLENVAFLRNEVRDLTSKIEEFKVSSAEFALKVERLERIIRILVRQLQALGQTPDCEKEIEEIMK